MHGSEGAGSQERRGRGGVCESQRRARAKRKAYDDDPKVAAAEDFPKRQMIEIHVQMDIDVKVSAWHCSPFSWEERESLLDPKAGTATASDTTHT